MGLASLIMGVSSGQSCLSVVIPHVSTPSIGDATAVVPVGPPKDPVIEYNSIDAWQSGFDSSEERDMISKNAHPDKLIVSTGYPRETTIIEGVSHIQFDNFDVSNNDTLKNATLVLTLYNDPGLQSAVEFTPGIHRNKFPWRENTLSANNSNWQISGPNMGSSRSTYTPGDEMRFNVIDAVRHWIKNPDENYGIIIQASGSIIQQEDIGEFRTFYSSRDLDNPPRLELEVWRGYTEARRKP